jgi:hypothetical protein
MTDVASAATCVLCGRDGPVTMDPPRRTIARGPDSEDHSFSVIAVLPDVVLCEEHAEDYARKHVVIGWCDDERCRIFGECGQKSPCGELYKALGRS